MRKSLVAIVIFSFLLVAVIGTGPVFGAALITRNYDNITTPGVKKVVDPIGLDWDLTRGPLTVSYTLDMSKYVPTETTTTEWNEVGIWGADSYFGWMSSGAPNAWSQNPSQWDPNDVNLVTTTTILNTVVPDNKEWTYDAYYDSTGKVTYFNPLVSKPWVIGSDGSYSYGIYFDRDGFDSTNTRRKGQWGLAGTSKTGGVYNIELKYYYYSDTFGVVFATINGVQQGFWSSTSSTTTSMQPKFYPVGKMFYGDTDQVRVFASLREGSTITNFKATGAPCAPLLQGCTPRSADQGDILSPMTVNGWEFREPTTPDESIDVALNKSNATLDGDTGEVINATNETFVSVNTVNTHVEIPEDATAGKWSVTYKQWGDDAVARMDNYFNVNVAPPKITSVTNNHCKRKQTVHMLINGKFFRNVGLTVQLKRGTEVINGKNVVWKSKNLIEADFTIPATATIAADWDVFVQHNDDLKYGVRKDGFSVDARIDVVPWVIWLHAPGFADVHIFSDTGFDATTVVPVSIRLGGMIPFWTTKRDINWDWKKDLELHFFNMFVTIPTGHNVPITIAGITNTGVPIKCYDTVDVFQFIF